MNCELQDKVFSVSAFDFDALALDIFRFQYTHNQVYRNFVDALPVDPAAITRITSIPFLPVGLFKSHEVVTGQFQPEVTFESSGTTQTGNSRHLVKKTAVYRESFSKTFELFYGDVKEWCVIGLLPSYLERQHSSLVMMVDALISNSGHPASGFYLYEYEKLSHLIRHNESAGVRTLLIGVTFALLDFAAEFPFPMQHTVVMETGGMKGRKKEMTREEVHEVLQSAWSLPSVHSEYGMTELLSQAYSFRKGLFECPPWMKIMIREEDDPLTVHSASEEHLLSGLVNVIDLANMYSCSFIAVDDIGKLYPGGSFEILGRMDGSDLRGCSLMYT